MNKNNKNKIVKYMVISLLLCSSACSSQISSTSTVVTKTSNDVIDLNLGPKGGGTIDPKITNGQTIINFKDGDGVLLFNLNLSGTGILSTKASTTPNIIYSTSVPVASVSPTPIPSVTPTPNSISKISAQIYINQKKYILDIPAEKISNNKYILNLTGLKKGDIVSLDTQVYDSKNTVVGKESAINKEVRSDVESFDLNISVNINISVEQKTEVIVSQSQVVTGPTINITLPTPPNNNSNNQPSANLFAPPPVNPVNNTNNNNSNTSSCLTPTEPPQNLVKMQDGTTIKICRPGEDTSSCYVPEANGNIKLSNGKIITICQPKR